MRWSRAPERSACAPRNFPHSVLGGDELQHNMTGNGSMWTQFYRKPTASAEGSSGGLANAWHLKESL